jgi:uncharacterized membrane protein YqgA involved in biofilm formation
MRGLGTIINVLAILAGSGLGILIGHRLPTRTQVTVMDALGLFTLVIAAMNCFALVDASYVAAVGTAAAVLIVLGAVVLGGIAGSLWSLDERLQDLGEWLRTRLSSGRLWRRRRAKDGRANDALTGHDVGEDSRFVEGFVTGSLLFCIGPLAIMGSLSDGLGQGNEQLLLKSTLDFFASLAFAATLGWGVAASALSVGVVQGLITTLALLLGNVLSDAEVASITATGGILLLGVGLRILQVRAVPVANLLPAVVLAPLLTLLVAQFR